MRHRISGEPDWLPIAESIDGWMTPAEMMWLHDKAKSLGVCRWAEVGSYHGRSSFAVAHGLAAGSSLILCDDLSINTYLAQCKSLPAWWQGAHLQATMRLIVERRPDIVVQFIGERSRDAAGKVGPVDIVFIDGDHGPAAVECDIRCWDAGEYCGHDYGASGVREGITASGIVGVQPGPGSIWHSGKWKRHGSTDERAAQGVDEAAEAYSGSRNR